MDKPAEVRSSDQVIGIFNGFHGAVSENAWEDLVKALERNPEDFKSLLGLSHFTVNLGERFSYLERAAAKAPLCPEVKKEVSDFVIAELAPLLKKESREEAYFLLLETVRVFPDCEPAWFCLAYVAQDDFDRRGCLEQILRLSPDNKAAAEWLATLNSPLEISDTDLFIRENQIILPTFSDTQNHSGSREENGHPTNVEELLGQIMEIEGTIGAALVDLERNVCLGSIGGAPSYNLEIAAKENAEVVRAKLRAMASLDLFEAIEDFLITLETQFHLIRIIKSSPNLFFFVAILRDKSNLGLARHHLSEIEARWEA